MCHTAIAIITAITAILLLLPNDGAVVSGIA